MHFFDTSVLVAAFDGQDSSHRRAFPVFEKHAGEGAISAHTIAETFSILTGRRGWRPNQAFEVLRTNTAPLRKIPLTPGDYLQTCESAQALGIRGGAVYDALILACARRAKATQIWTLNSHHFLLFAPEMSSAIREP